MTINIRKAVRVLLLNDKSELLLMCVQDFDICTPEGKRYERFWCTIGGGIEFGESIEQTAYRETFEEAGITKEHINLGPIVWYGNVEVILKGTLTKLEELFVVAKTKQENVVLHAPTEDEKKHTQQLRWFSLEDIQKSQELIFPESLCEHLPNILLEKYPKKPIKIKC